MAKIINQHSIQGDFNHLLIPNFGQSSQMILVTGGTGLVGSHLLYMLLKKGKKVRATYRSEKSLAKTKALFKHHHDLALFDQIEWIEADLLDYFSLVDSFEGIEYVYHAAALVSFNKNQVEHLMEINVEGTKHLVNISLEKGIKKFCFVSSVAALGEYENRKCTDENALWQFTENTTAYSVSKYYAENEVWRASEEGLPVVIVNPTTILGIGSIEESSLTIFKKVKEGLQYYTPGSNGFIGVIDVSRSMIQLMESNIVNERFILVSENWTFKQLLSSIALGFGQSPPQKEATWLMAKTLLLVDQCKSFLFRTNPTLTKESVAIAYKKKCYSAEKFLSALDFQFEPIEPIIRRTTDYFKSVNQPA